MISTFADSVYFIALLNPRDEYHQEALQLASGPQRRLTTTAWVIAEVANQMSRPPNRTVFLAFLRDLERTRQFDLVLPTATLYEDGLQLYAAREDKEWSLTDCISFLVMQRENISEALTADHHFEQAGFTILLK